MESWAPKRAPIGFQPWRTAIIDINVENIEGAVSHAIRLVGTCIEIFGVFIIVAGIVWSTYIVVYRRNVRPISYDEYKISIGRSLLLGLDVLVAADSGNAVSGRVTATNAAGSTSATSNAIAVA